MPFGGINLRLPAFLSKIFKRARSDVSRRCAWVFTVADPEHLHKMTYGLKQLSFISKTGDTGWNYRFGPKVK
jgi:hypothetical protein